MPRGKVRSPVTKPRQRQTEALADAITKSPIAQQRTTAIGSPSVNESHVTGAFGPATAYAEGDPGLEF